MIIFTVINMDFGKSYHTFSAGFVPLFEFIDSFFRISYNCILKGIVNVQYKNILFLFRY